MRSRSAKIAQNATPAEALPLSARSAVRQGPLQAVWVGPALVLARRVRVDEGTFLQGCWLDWEFIRSDLIGSVADLLPHARLEPVRGPVGPAPARMLASLPVRLVPGRVPDAVDLAWSPVRLSLWIAWACLALAAAAVALLLRGALALSERRGTFVSAVTHELRTPLTTFRLYTEMLDEGMVTDAESQTLLPEDPPFRGRPARPSGRKRAVVREAGAGPSGRRPGIRHAGRVDRPLGSPASPCGRGRRAWNSK